MTTPPPDLDGPRRAYVDAFATRYGYDPATLDAADRARILELLSRAEEHDCPHLHNGHNWEMRYATSRRRGEQLRPVIEELLEGRAAAPRSPRWPDGKRFALCLTHDVDGFRRHPYLDRLRQIPRLGGAPMRRRGLIVGSAVRQAARRLRDRARHEAFPFEIWMEAEAAHGFRSTFFFVPWPMVRPAWDDPAYRYDDRVSHFGRSATVAEVIADVARRGWEAGIHGSTASHADAAVLREEKATVEAASGAPVTSIRQHHLMCDVRHTPRVHEEAGLLVDSTFGLNTDLGFRCGTGLPFHIYDLERDRPYATLQVPLVVQDVAIVGRLERDEEMIVARVLEVVDRVAEVGGAITLLWHNTYEPDSLEFGIYRRLLAECASRGAWGCSARQLAEHVEPELFAPASA